MTQSQAMGLVDAIFGLAIAFSAFAVAIIYWYKEIYKKSSIQKDLQTSRITKINKYEKR
jgi:hypothetical protein